MITPGQLWSWVFNVGDGTWHFEVITREARESFVFVISHLVLHRGQQFIVIATDDPGQTPMPGSDMPRYDEFGSANIDFQFKRWHVAMHKEKLFWIEHTWFEHAELLNDVKPQESSASVSTGNNGDNTGRDIHDDGHRLRANATRTSNVCLMGCSAVEESRRHNVALVRHGDAATSVGRLGLGDG